MPRSSFAKVVRNRREDLPEGMRPWMAEAQEAVKKVKAKAKKVAEVVAPVAERVKRNRAKRHAA